MKVGRNDPCPCGSGKKYKHCCYATDSVKHEPDPELDEQAPVAEAESDATHATHAEHGEHAEHAEQRKAFDADKGRGRFHGNQRGGASSFSPRVFRGSQRGH